MTFPDYLFAGFMLLVTVVVLLVVLVIHVVFKK
jgi:hypothetical protein